MTVQYSNTRDDFEDLRNKLINDLLTYKNIISKRKKKENKCHIYAIVKVAFISAFVYNYESRY